MIGKFFIPASLAGLALATCAPASAQTAPPQSPSQQPAQSLPNMGKLDEFFALEVKAEHSQAVRQPVLPRMIPQQQAMNTFGRCVWQQAPERARAALATPIDTAAEAKALNEIASLGACLDARSLSGRSGEFRGALAEGAIHLDADRMARIAAIVPSNATRVPTAKGRSFVASYAGCIAAADPAGSLALLQTPVGTDEETASVRAMGPALMGCMPEGAQYRIDIRDVRNHIADALYRMSEVPSA